MSPQETPTIKGIFVNSHVKAVREKKGETGLTELKKRFGKSIQFNNTDNIPVRDEVHLIECALDVLNDNTTPPQDKAFEAGKLHFTNFITTPLARIIFSFFKDKFKVLMLNTPNIAGHVFQHVGFTAEELGPQSVKVTMHNNDYPIDHFRGLFQAWMDYAGLSGTVTAEQTDHRYEYTMTWK